MVKIIDTNNETTSRLGDLRNQGVECIIRYISTNTSGSKVVKPAEARAIAAAGLKLALVFEVWGGVNNFAHDDIDGNSGTSHGPAAASSKPLNPMYAMAMTVIPLPTFAAQSGVPAPMAWPTSVVPAMAMPTAGM